MVQPSLSLLYLPIMLLAVVVGVTLGYYYKSSLRLTASEKLFIGMAAFCGAVAGAKMPYLLQILPGFEGPNGLFFSSKTIVFGMAGGYLGVELAKWTIGVREKTGDSFVIPVAISIGIGRIGCFVGGCCYGAPSDLPWAVTYSLIDAIPRHPTQLYEAAFHFAAAMACAFFLRRQIMRHQLIKFYFISYFAFRFLTEWIRTEKPVFWGFTAYQCATFFLILLFSWLWVRDEKVLNVANRIEVTGRSLEPYES